MLAIRLSNRLQALFGHRVSPAEFLRDHTVPELLARVVGISSQAAVTAPDRVEPAVETRASPLADGWADEDALDLLEELAARGLLAPGADEDTAPPRERLRVVLEEHRSFELYPTSHGQAAIWFMQQLSPENVAYNLMFAARVAAKVDEEALDRAVRATVERHPALRTVFVEGAGRPYQLILSAAEYEFLTVDGSGLDDEEVHDLLVTYGHEPLDLERGPILRVVLVSRGAEDNFLLVVIHHVAADASSVDVVARDLRDCYARALHGDLGTQAAVARYTDFVDWERAWLERPEAGEALLWWRKQLADPPAHLDLPAASAELAPAADRLPETNLRGVYMTFCWDADDTRRLKAY
ncbi:condensation domain-containing protein [Streptomyces sp. NPDC006476]|uniref:condensation domain-containing protein n=1 Tax=Streptomyces sp. NPDC006476 TaxID=3157175 RepID=UPI00339F3EBC